MSESARRAESVIPAQLSFLSIYNPSLGDTDESLHEQIVYYFSKDSTALRRGKSSREVTIEQQHEEKNERLRQVGLAQGIVEFAKAFSDGEAVDSIDTEKSKIVIHELEAGWWIIASIDLTRLPSASDRLSPSGPQSDSPTHIEYSAREVCPHMLLSQHLLRAHSIFLLHHAPSLEELYLRLTRPKFCGALERFWSTFARNWDVLLHGNPAVDIFNGLKLAAGGELGIGVGEEEWGSGEREVLEGFVDRTDGLVDLVVSRFGEAPEIVDNLASDASVRTSRPFEDTSSQWLGGGQAPRSSDGVVFSGIGAITRPSLRDVSSWIEWLYKYGDDAYGVRDNPHSDHRRKRRKINASGPSADSTISTPNSRGRKAPTTTNSNAQESNSTPSIPAPIVPTASSLLEKMNASGKASRENSRLRKSSRSVSPPKHDESASGTETLMKYLTLGVYGSSWGISGKRPAVHRQISRLREGNTPADGEPQSTDKSSAYSKEQKSPEKSNASEAVRTYDLTHGRFMIGLQGDLEQESLTEDEADADDAQSGAYHETGLEEGNWNKRTLLRTLHIERVRRTHGNSATHADKPEEIVADDYYDRLQVVVYVHQPFIYTFLFELHTDSLSIPSFYKSLHYQLGPLQRPLLASTSPTKVFERLWEASIPISTTSAERSQPIYDLVYDPTNLTVHTSIPMIPEPGTAAAEGLGIGPTESPWTRVEALNVHLQILNTYIATRRRLSELERTCKTSRGWWVVWMRLPHKAPSNHMSSSSCREAILIRKASDYIAPSARKVSGMFGRDLSGSSAASGWGPGKLAEGIGIDTRRYIEGLLSLNR